MAWTPIAPWKIIQGTGRTVTVSNGANTADTVKMGAQTQACALSLSPAATAYGALVTISSGVAATATTDLCLKSTDPPLIVGCSPGDKVEVWGLAAGTLFICEMSH